LKKHIPKDVHMNKDIVTTDHILHTMKAWVENRMPIAPSKWLDAALKLQVLKGNEDDHLFDLEAEVATLEAELIAEGLTSVHAKTVTKTNAIWKEMKKQGAKIKRIEEFGRIAKKQATLKDNEWIS